MKAALAGAVVGSALALIGCVPAHPELVDRERYLCCNLFFNQRRVATDANYGAPQGEVQRAGFALEKRGDMMLPVGTRVRIVDTGDDRIAFTPSGSKSVFVLQQRFGKGYVSAGEFFARTFVDDDPRRQLVGTPAELLEAIRTAHVVRGMTKAQVTMARAHPAPHRTPSLDADEWIYFPGRFSMMTVRFVDGKVDAVTTADTRASAAP